MLSVTNIFIHIPNFYMFSFISINKVILFKNGVGVQIIKFKKMHIDNFFFKVSITCPWYLLIYYSFLIITQGLANLISNINLISNWGKYYVIYFCIDMQRDMRPSFTFEKKNVPISRTWLVSVQNKPKLLSCMLINHTRTEPF